MKAEKETKTTKRTDVSSARDAAADLAEEYREALAACGLSLKISKKYFRVFLIMLLKTAFVTTT